MISANKRHDELSRRSLLTGGLAAGFVLAFHLPLRAAVNEPVQPADVTDGKFAPNAFIRIDETGRVTLVMPQVEMGQGVYTAIPMILAEELDADIAQVALLHAPPNDKLYGNPTFGLQVTGNSNSIRAFWKPLRNAGASARAMLVQAAAAEWRVEAASCTTSKSEVTHTASGRKLSYGALAIAASSVAPPKDVPLKDPKDFIYIGQPLKRLDTPDKVNGKAVYGIDAILPDMKFATVAACPVFGGKVGKVDDSAAKKIPGVRKIVVLDDMVAVIGDHMWAAKKGLDALKIDWDEGPNARISSKDIWQHLRAASEKDGAVAKSVGDIAKGLSTGEKFEAAYELPFLAHAAMEPLNATVHVRPDACEIWTGTQIVSRVQSEAAKAAGLPVEKVIVNNHLLGGGFGRKLEPDMVIAAVRVAKQVDYPVKVVWTREEDTQHDVYRPVYHNNITAVLVDGKVAAWKHRITGSAILARWLPPAFQKGIDIDAVDARSMRPTTSRTSTSNMSAPSPRRCRPVSGAASGRTTTCSRSSARWMNWRARPARTRSNSAAPCSAASRGRWRCSISRRKKPIGARNCRRVSAAASACSLRSRHSSQPSWKPRSTKRARWRFAASPRWSIPASPSTPIP